jgi:hypothetical protein
MNMPPLPQVALQVSRRRQMAELTHSPITHLKAIKTLIPWLPTSGPGPGPRHDGPFAKGVTRGLIMPTIILFNPSS